MLAKKFNSKRNYLQALCRAGRSKQKGAHFELANVAGQLDESEYMTKLIELQ